MLLVGDCVVCVEVSVLGFSTQDLPENPRISEDSQK